MAGAFSVGGLITGLDTNNIISQLMQIERQPITRLQQQITGLQSQQSALRDLRTKLLALRNSVQDFRLKDIFNQYQAASSEEKVMTAGVSGENPVVGSYSVNVTQLASATVASSSGVLGAAINAGTNLNASGMTTAVTAGAFMINGVSFTVDPATQSLNTILGQINSSTAGVTAMYDPAADKVTIANTAAGNTGLINFGATSDTSNFLDALNIKQATQSTNGSGSTQATSTRNLGAIDTSKTLNQISFAGGAVTAGTIFINGISITVDPTTDAISDVLQRINDSDAQATASYDAASDKIRVVSDTLGSRTISFASGTSNLLAVTTLTTAVQTAGNDSTFTVNGGPAQTRNTNEVADAIGGVTLKFLSTGTSAVTVSGDNDKIVEDMKSFITAFNDSIDQIRTLIGKDGALAGDGSIQGIENYLRDTAFSQVTGISGTYTSLIDLGITTGSAFDASAVSHLELNEDTFREALRKDRVNVQAVFNNSGKNGVGDLLFGYLDETTRTTGFLNGRAKANGGIDQQIQAVNDNIARMEDRVSMKEERLRKQFAQLEQLSASMQSSNTALSSLSSSLQSFYY
jgi:flagellar hook-associated protein 2